MTAYAIANLRDVNLGAGIVEYLERIDATLAPYQGHFIVHGDEPERMDGHWVGIPVVIAFPSVAQARGWWASDEYSAAKAIRQRAARTDMVVVEGA